MQKHSCTNQQLLAESVPLLLKCLLCVLKMDGTVITYDDDRLPPFMITTFYNYLSLLLKLDAIGSIIIIG